MAKSQSNAVARKILPVNPVVFVSEQKILKLRPADISPETVGQKTFGLASLPSVWTLPFIGISADLFKQYRSAPKSAKKILEIWSNTVSVAAQRVGIGPDEEILIRSSGVKEGIGERGKFHSTVGTLTDVQSALAKCLAKLADEKDAGEEQVALVLQRKCIPERAKGHLSNERRCYKEKRDWIGERESANTNTLSLFQVNLRNWRETLPQKESQPLSCSLTALISEVLKIPAAWAYRKGTRVHFEWAWNGKTVYLVQADEEAEWGGHDPVKEHRSRNYKPIDCTPKCIRQVSTDDASAARFAKVSNVLTYLRLKLPTARLYILDDQEIIHRLSKGDVPTTLEADVSELVKGSLVIRTDLATSDLGAKQLLPRTQEMKEAPVALRWMSQQAKILCNAGVDAAFIFHNFIPALSAAFAYADPGVPLVQIESLWGLPEGLYYNTHDKFVLDTIKCDINAVAPSDIPGFVVRKKLNFKHFFVSTTPSGKWETLAVRPPYDWGQSVSDEDCKMIALESRRIAQAEGHSVSVMWFIGVPPSVAARSAIPWYHEKVAAPPPAEMTRAKTPFDKFYVIRSVKDLEGLKNVQGVNTTAPRIKVQPIDEKLLREKSTLRTIGEYAKAKGAIIVLEGAILSHAYYQLLNTGATVEVVHPFIGFEERHDYNKLVRDKIPEQIRQRGESVTTAQLYGDALVTAFREKLVEEAYELLDAKDLNSIIAELADIREVIDSLVQKLGVQEKVLADEQAKKRQKRGGFLNGTVLVQTESRPQTSRPLAAQEDLMGLKTPAAAGKEVDESEVRRRNELLEKKTDRRKIGAKVEVRARISVPVIRSTPWETQTSEERIEGAKGKTVTGAIKGFRNGSRWTIDVSVSIDEAQPEMF